MSPFKGVLPREYAQVVRKRCIDRVAAGDRIRRVARDEGVPQSTVFLWCRLYGIRSAHPAGRPKAHELAGATSPAPRTA